MHIVSLSVKGYDRFRYRPRNIYFSSSCLGVALDKINLAQLVYFDTYPPRGKCPTKSSSLNFLNVLHHLQSIQYTTNKQTYRRRRRRSSAGVQNGLTALFVSLLVVGCWLLVIIAFFLLLERGGITGWGGQGWEVTGRGSSRACVRATGCRWAWGTGWLKWMVKGMVLLIVEGCGWMDGAGNG